MLRKLVPRQTACSINIVIRLDAFEPDTAFDCVQHADGYVEGDTRGRMTSSRIIILANTWAMCYEDDGKWRWRFIYSKTRY
jgi:hypothetical protein